MSQSVQQIRTFRDPALSLWQSAVHKAITRRAAKAVAGFAASAADSAMPSLGASAADPHMLATVAAAGAAFVRGPRPAAESVGDTLATCAELYVKLAVAKFLGNEADITSLENEISFSECDPLWAEALLDYEEFLLEKGWDEKYGARPLRRAVENYLEDPLAEAILRGEVRRGEPIRVTFAGGEALKFEQNTPVA